MKCTIQNLARRPLSLHCNSGKTLHLPSAYALELPEEEIIGNAMVEKLASRKLLSVKKAESSIKPKSTSKKAESSIKSKNASKKAESSIKSKSVRKKGGTGIKA